MVSAIIRLNLITGLLSICITGAGIVGLAEKSIRGNPEQLTPYLTLASSYSSLNRDEEACMVVEDALRIDPNFSLEHYAKMLPYKNQESFDNYINSLRKAGLPE